MRLPVDAENAVRSALDGQALDGLETASEAGPVDQLMLVKVASDADLVDLAVSEEIRHYPDHEGSTNPTGMWQRA